MEEFILRALLGGMCVAIVCGPLGCLIVWQRMTYFGAALSHAALLGVALGLVFNLNLQLSILALCITVSLLLLAMERNSNITSDTALGIIAHSTLAVGILVLTLIPSIRLDLMGYLFGDILSIRWTDVYWVLLGGVAILFALSRIWKPLLSLIVQRDLALVDGVNEQKIRLIFLILLSVVITISMQLIGILLVISLLIIPAACASRYSSSPEQMAWLSSLIGIISVASGMGLSLTWDTPAGPSIVTCASVIYLVSMIYKRKQPI